MPVLTIDGRKIETQPGKTIIEAALDNGISIPHFCWHPALSVAGNCRMCLVQVGSQKKNAEGQPETDGDGNPVIAWIPKLQIACATPVTDGMYVDTSGEKTTKATNAVMEFLLINHPLDCPICDEAGQCKLQEYAYRFSKGESRFDELKNHKDKRVQWGPEVMFDGERCISCSRCIRFAEEVAEQPVISFVQRGDHVTIETFEGTQFDSPYSMNVIELCPVGALTSIDFRFKARVWDMSFNDSICPGCSRGCNIQIGVRDNTILRLEPKTNPHVNQYWMCDAGRNTQYAWVNENRISGAWLRKGGTLQQSDWKESYSSFAASLKQFSGKDVMFILSGMATNEDAYLTQKLAAHIKSTNVVFIERNDASFGDTKLRSADRNANSNGMAALGIKSLAPTALASALQGVKAVVVVGDEIIRGNEEIASAVRSLAFVGALSFNHCQTTEAAHAVLATATYAESEGTFTNLNRRVQHFTPAIVTTENMRIMGMKMSRLDKFGAHNDRWTQGDKRDCKQSWRIVQGIANELGAGWLYKSSEDIFNEMALTLPAFKNMSYDMLDTYLGVALDKGHAPEPVGIIYESHTLKPN
ncbi:MAG: (2Fe-2S)-binding protein [Candidatus Kapabacteria bacterium]|nr:(2Fe-2S)-binding protein [Candidatus Kapabacteria bacterium]